MIFTKKRLIMRKLYITLGVCLLSCLVVDSLFHSNIDVNCAVFPIIGAIGLGLSALSAGVGAAKSAKSNKKARQQMRALKAEQDAEYLTEKYRSALDNDGAKAYLKKLDEVLRDRNKATENNLASTNATYENALAQKNANNKIYSQSLGDLVDREDKRKDILRREHNSNKATAATNEANYYQNQGNTWSQLGSDLGNTFTQAGFAFDKTLNPNLTTTTPEVGKGK